MREFRLERGQQSGENAMRKKLTLRVDSDLVQQAKALGINISRLTEKAIAASTGNRTYMHVQSDIVQPEMQSTQNGTNSENGLDDEVSWRVGRNPSSVLGDIHLIGIPAPQAKFTGTYCPFHSVGWHFTLPASLLNASASLSTTGGGFFLRLYPTSRPTLHSATVSPCGWSFLKPSV